LNLTKKIADGYWAIAFKNGALILKQKLPFTNVHELKNYAIEETIPVPGLISLLSRMNIEERRPKYQDAVEKIKAATGEEYSLDEQSVESIYEKSDARDRARIGDLLYAEVLPNLAFCLEKALQDEMVKEAFLEMTPARQIAFAVDNKQGKYWEIKYKDGTVILSAKVPLCNLGEVRNLDIESSL